MFEKRLLLILLLATVLIYCGAVYWSIQDYEEYKNARLERYPEEVRPFVDFSPYIFSGRGILMIVLGAIIGSAWAMISLILQSIERKATWRHRKTKLRIAALATVIIAGAAYPLAYAAYKIFYLEPFFLENFWGFPDGFVSTVYWTRTILVWSGLGVFWLAVAAIRVLKPRLYSDQ